MREGTPEGDSHRGAAVPLGHLWRLFSPQGGPPARTRKPSSLWPACEEDCPFVVLNHGTELPRTVGTGSSALRGRADCHGGAHAGGGSVIQHLLSTYYVPHTGMGAVDINLHLVMAWEGLRGSEREKNTDPFVLGLLLPAVLGRQRGRSKNTKHGEVVCVSLRWWGRGKPRLWSLMGWGQPYLSQWAARELRPFTFLRFGFLICKLELKISSLRASVRIK